MAYKDGSKSGGRKIGSVNRATRTRQEQMAKVNEALKLAGKDPLTGQKLLSDVLNDPNTPLDLKISCGAHLLKHETPQAEEQIASLDEWRALYMKAKPDASPEDVDYHEALAKQVLANKEGLTSPADKAPWLNPDDKKDEPQ